MPHQYRSIQIGAALIAAFVAAASGQSVPGLDQKTQAEFDRIKGLSGLQQAIAATELTGNFILTAIWPKITQVNKVPPGSPKPRVKGIFSETRQAPFVDGDQLYFPALYYELLYELSYLVGHDVYVEQGHSIQVANPLLNAPFGSSGILKLLEEPVLYLQNEYFAAMNPFVTCSNATANCVRVQQTALSCNILLGRTFCRRPSYRTAKGIRTRDPHPQRRP